MHPMVVTALLALVYLAAAAVGLGALLWAGARRTGEGVTIARAAAAGLVAATAAGMAYAACILALDNTRTPLLNWAFALALCAAAPAAGIALWKAASIGRGGTGLNWGRIGRGWSVALLVLTPLVVVMPLLAILRVEGARLRAHLGCYRGYEDAWRYARTDPPDAMSTPERAFTHYCTLAAAPVAADNPAARERILTTASHKDVQWFLDNRELIAEHFGGVQPSGAGRTAAQRRSLAMAVITRPVSPLVRKMKLLGDDAVIVNASGQVVWLTREGTNWKIRDFLGARSWAMDEVRGTKQANGTMTPDDEHWYSILGPKTREDLRALCAGADIPYRDFDPAVGADDPALPLPAAARTRSHGIAEPAQPDRQPAWSAPHPVPVRLAMDAAAARASVPTVLQAAAAATQLAVPETVSGPPASAAVPVPTPAEKKGLFGFLGRYAAHDAVEQANAATGERTAMPESLAEALVTPKPPDPTAPTPTPRPENAIMPNVPVDTLWPAYRKAAEMVSRGDPAGVAAFEALISTEDREWLERNARVIAAIVTPARDYNDPVLPRLAALQALLRSMPLQPEPAGPAVTAEDGYGMATVTDSALGGASYATAIVQENGRWLVARFFYARDFVWVPQLALFKHSHGAHLTPDEKQFLAGGFVPFQESTRRYLARLGK